MTNEQINQTIIRNEKSKMTLSKALQALNSIQDHDVKMHLIDVMAELANDQFKRGMSISEDIWRPRDINQESNK
jgi:hypothetical protein